MAKMQLASRTASRSKIIFSHQEKCSKKPMLVGTNANEAALFLITDNHLFQGMFPFRYMLIEKKNKCFLPRKNNEKFIGNLAWKK